MKTFQENNGVFHPQWNSHSHMCDAWTLPFFNICLLVFLSSALLDTPGATCSQCPCPEQGSRTDSLWECCLSSKPSASLWFCEIQHDKEVFLEDSITCCSLGVLHRGWVENGHQHMKAVSFLGTGLVLISWSGSWFRFFRGTLSST